MLVSSYNRVRCHGELTGYDRRVTYVGVGGGLWATATLCAANGFGRANMVVRLGV